MSLTSVSVRGAPMNISRSCLALIVLGLTASISMADSVDPRFMPIGGGGSIVLTSPTDPAFTFSYLFGTTPTVDCGGSGGPSGDQCINPLATEFVNNSHVTWTAVTLEITEHSPSGTSGLTFSPLDTVSDPYFVNAESGILEDGNPFVRFFGTDATHPGILPAFGCDGNSCSGPTSGENPVLLLYDFSILSDVQDAQFQGASFTVQGSATTAVPEPPAALLALGGGLLLLFFKRS
jgi:hypothetical protein